MVDHTVFIDMTGVQSTWTLKVCELVASFSGVQVGFSCLGCRVEGTGFGDVEFRVWVVMRYGFGVHEVHRA